MKVAIIGDLHWGTRGGDPVFMDFQMNYFERFIDAAKKREVEQVIQVGDWLDVRKNTNNLLIHKLCVTVPHLIKRSGMKWIKVRGNHECFYRDDNVIGADMLLHELSDVVVVSEFYEEGDFAFCAWMNKNNSEHLLSELAKSKAKYCFGHFEPAGFPMYKNTPLSTHGISIDVLSKFELVFSGHYHTVSRQKNFQMVGSPYHLTWADYPDGTNRGWFLLDTETGEYEMIQNEESDSLFDAFYYDPQTEYKENTLKKYEGKIVRVVVESKPDPKHFKKFKSVLDTTKFIDYGIIDLTVAENKQVKIDAKALEVDTLSVLTNYIHSQEMDGLDKDAVSALSSDIYNRAQVGQ
ncbi:hypothetical protein [Ralstonia phage RSP15]|uniref:hypothetical protein n=1 Tax=Ralstonia phage RSP15 TaxID=1785960 RepID=UPI00074D4429|nr:hypothetical protein BH754_gp112 [Ralstonia phage RSP15]BAU40194.1 hypothetical protein [Ralstonia phage RSP15]